jgi:hypothetical protein
MIRNLKYGLFVAILGAIVYGILHFFGWLPGLLKGSSGDDSPIEVVGGSIFLEWEQAGYKAPTYPCPNVNPAMYCGQSDDLTKLDFDNLNIPTTTAPYGWIIHVTDQYSHAQDDAITVCSNRDCTASAPAGNTTYYVKLRDREIVDPSAPPSILGANNEMHFHNDRDCPGGKEDRRCDRAATFTVDIGTADGKWISTSANCANNTTADPKKRCRVLIGTVTSH